MKYLLISLFLVFSAYCKGQSFEDKPSWEEHFNYSGLPDTTKWKYNTWSSKEEIQKYVAYNIKNTEVKKGRLYLSIIRNKSLITSSRIETKKSFCYGKIEIKAKCSVGKGVWPAIWMIPIKYKTVKGGEIDIMEYRHCWKGKQFWTNIHIRNNRDRKIYPKIVNAHISKFHLYELDWYKDKLVFYVDKEKYYEYKKTSDDQWYFDVPYNLIFNIAFGGWGGACGIDNKIFPRRLVVDYIKYYKLKE